MRATTRIQEAREEVPAVIQTLHREVALGEIALDVRSRSRARETNSHPIEYFTENNTSRQAMRIDHVR